MVYSVVIWGEEEKGEGSISGDFPSFKLGDNLVSDFLVII